MLPSTPTGTPSTLAENSPAPWRLGCYCQGCNAADSLSRMFVCPSCGFKRCPRATDHRLACTSSNDPGQPGSAWGARVFAPLSLLTLGLSLPQELGKQKQEWSTDKHRTPPSDEATAGPGLPPVQALAPSTTPGSALCFLDETSFDAPESSGAKRESDGTQGERPHSGRFVLLVERAAPTLSAVVGEAYVLKVALREELPQGLPHAVSTLKENASVELRATLLSMLAQK